MDLYPQPREGPREGVEDCVEHNYRFRRGADAPLFRCSLVVRGRGWFLGAVIFGVQPHGGGTFPIVVSGPIRGRDPGLWLPASTLGNVVHSPKTLGVAYEDPPRCEDKSLNESMNANCCQCVGGTAGGISAPGAQSWGDVALVGDDGRRKKRSKSPTRDSHRASHLRHARAITRSRWSPSSLEGTPRALDEARTTTLLPSGRSQTRSRMRWRSCRLTRLRPLARLISRLGTTKPTRRLLRSSSARTWTTTSGSPARAPCRIAAVKSAGSTMAERSEERRVGKECRSRWSPYH